MMTMLALLGLAAAGGGPDDPYAQVARLLPRLEDDSAEVREAGTAELLAVGDRGAPALRGLLLGGALGPETQGRLRAVLARWEADRRRREFRGGPRVGDLAASLEARWDNDRRRCSVTVTIMNLGVRKTAIIPVERWGVASPGGRLYTSRHEARVRIDPLSSEPDTGEVHVLE